jgi:protein TonB
MARKTRKFSGIAGSLLSAAIAAVLLSACGGGSDQAAKTAAAPAKTDAAKPADATAAPAADQAAAAPAPLKSMSVGDLLKAAGKALGDARLIAPPGNNAAEYYLAVLDKDSNNNAARDGLREMFPLATGAIEKQINDGQLDEGKRAIDLLSKADPNNYALTILRSKLDLKRKQQADQDKRDQDKQNQEKALAAAKAAAANQTAAAPATPAPAPATAAAPAPAAANAAAKPTQTASATPPKPVAAAPAPEAGGETHPARLLNRVNPAYPSEAVRNRQEGWVEVAFTVSADGRVRDVSVVSSNPPRVFNASAVRAVEGWTFSPRMENGKAAEQQIRTRLEFKL